MRNIFYFSRHQYVVSIKTFDFFYLIYFGAILNSTYSSAISILSLIKRSTSIDNDVKTVWCVSFLEIILRGLIFLLSSKSDVLSQPVNASNARKLWHNLNSNFFDNSAKLKQCRCWFFIFLADSPRQISDSKMLCILKYLNLLFKFISLGHLYARRVIFVSD